MKKDPRTNFIKFIFVEGDDDFHFLCNLLEVMSIDDIYIEKINGKDNLKRALRAFSTLPLFESVTRLFVILDADESFQNTESSMVSILSEISIPTPSGHNIIAENEDMKVSFFIMPGNKQNGAIEDLILNHASKKEVFKHVEDLFEDIKSNEGEIKKHNAEYSYPLNDKKAKLQVYLSCNKESDSRIGVSIKKKIIDTDDACFDEIKGFILNMQ